MSWFYEDFYSTSTYNGEIHVRRLLGTWSVVVNGCDQTSPYLKKMWRTLFRTHPLHPAPRAILMLGLGAGGEISTLNRVFPNSTLTVIEQDPEMVLLSKKLQLYKPYPYPQVIEGNALEIVPTLPTSFDLIICDIFEGKSPSHIVGNIDFLKTIREKLTSTGYAVFNIYADTDLLTPLQSVFSRCSPWTYKFNTIVLCDR